MIDQTTHFNNENNSELSEDTAIREVIEDITDMLAAMTMEERIAWFRKAQYPSPVNFQREIGGTVYTVNTYFNTSALESIREKAERVILKSGAKS